MTVIKRQTIIGTLWAYLGVLVGSITQAYLIPNYLTTEENGLLAMLMSWMMIFVLLANLGFTSAGVRFFDQFRDKEKGNNGFLFNALVALLVGCLLVSFIVWGLQEQILSSNAGDTSLFEKYYYVILPITFATATFNIFDNYAKSLHDTITGNFLNQFLQRFLVLLAVVFYIAHRLDTELFVGIWAVAICVPAILMFFHIHHIGALNFKPSSFLLKSDFLKPFLSFAGFSVVTSLSSIAITKLDTLMVYEFLGLSQTGIYNTCLFFGSVMTISYSISLKASTAIVLTAMEENDFEKVKSIFQKSSVTQVFFGTILLVLVWVNVDVLFSFIKPEYYAGKYVLLIIGIAKLYDLASGLNSLILGYSKYYKLDSLLVISFVGILYLLNHLLIPSYGLNGAAFAALIATVYYNTIRNILIWKFFKIHPYTKSVLFILLTGLLVTIIGLYLPDLKLHDNLDKILSLLYKCSVTGLLLISSLYFLNVSREINQIIDDTIKKLSSLF